MYNNYVNKILRWVWWCTTINPAFVGCDRMMVSFWIAWATQVFRAHLFLKSYFLKS
jgi:hypothetical protein